MNPVSGTHVEMIGGEDAVAAQERVSAILHGADAHLGAGAISSLAHQAGQVGPIEVPQAATAVPPVTSPVPAPTRAAAAAARTKTRNGGAKRGAGSGGSATTTATPGDPAVSVSLPREVYDHFAGKAAADERTLATYLKRVLRNVYQRERQQQAEPQSQC